MAQNKIVQRRQKVHVLYTPLEPVSKHGKQDAFDLSVGKINLILSLLLLS